MAEPQNASHSRRESGSALPLRTVALAVVGLIAGLLLHGAVSPNRYAGYITGASQGALFAASLAALFLLFFWTRRLPWWVAAPLFTGTGFLFLATCPIR